MQNKCSILECPNIAKVGGLCKKCYDNQRKNLRNERRRNIVAAKKITHTCIVNSCYAKALPNIQICAKRRTTRAKSTKEYRQKNPARVKTMRQRSRHKFHYHEPYENKIIRLNNQNNKCANLACQTTDPGARGWQTDHNHKTGHIRGELCGPCNRILGHAQDDPAILQGLIDYLNQTQ